MYKTYPLNNFLLICYFEIKLTRIEKKKFFKLKPFERTRSQLSNGVKYYLKSFYGHLFIKNKIRLEMRKNALFCIFG
jgi:hypothetical protein